MGSFSEKEDSTQVLGGAGKAQVVGQLDELLDIVYADHTAHLQM